MTKIPISTYILLGINLSVFGLLALQQGTVMFDSDADAMAILRVGANFNPFTLGTQPWRILTSMFLHYGIIHLAVNMYALYTLGMLLEPAMGTTRFLLLYFFCGIAAGLASLLFLVYIPSAGASGALFGLFGYQLSAEIIGNFHDRKRLMTVFLNFVVFVVINAFIATKVNVDIAGHIGGFLGGLLLGVFHFKLRWFIQEKFLALLLLLLASTLLLLPKDQVRYYEIFQRVLKTDDRVNNFYVGIRSDGEIRDSLAALLPIWDSISSSLNDLKNVPPQLAGDTATLRDYVQLRRQATAYRVKLIERQSYIYLDSLEILDAAFDSLPRLQYVLNFKIKDSEPPTQDTATTAPPLLYPAKVYYDDQWKEVDDVMSVKFFRVGQKDSLGRWQGPLKDFFKDGQIQMKGKYEKNLKDGVFIYYSNRRTYQSAGRYDKEYAVGKWENFHWNGALESEVFYGDETFTANVFDSLGNQQVKNGNGIARNWYPSGAVAEEGEYKNGKKEGLWYGFHPNGQPYYKEQYRNNRLIHGVSEDSKGKRYVYDYLSELPFPVVGMPAFKKYVDQNKRTPFQSRHGKVKVVFSVGLDGSTWNYAILQSVSPECDEEAIRLLADGPAWRPGLLHGQEKIPSQGYVEIEF
ncbi:MAG TPA: rhomboid family intramembrane serine protease [Chryseolinea sp.]|nr:rhomboid family intramembrane serine protease [Chryseolinea sp.]